MARKIVWSRKASQSFDKILEYIIFKFGETSGIKFVQNVDFVINQISFHPFLGKLEESQYKFRSIIISKKTSLIYSVEVD
jgi:plasmid stabilization system protein ParE